VTGAADGVYTIPCDGVGFVPIRDEFGQPERGAYRRRVLMRSLIALLAILLGVLGVLACAGAGVGAWRTSLRVSEKTQNVAERVDTELTRVDEALGRVEQTVMVSSVALAMIRKRAEAIDEARGDAGPLSHLLQELKPHLERVNTVADVLASLAILLENVAAMLERGEHPTTVQGLRTATANLTTAAAELREVTAAFDKRLARIEQLTPKALLSLIAKAVVTVEVVQKAVATVRGYAPAAREEVANVRAEVDFWTRVIPGVVTVVLVWIALGQLCLIGWGYRRLGRPTPV
jgi:hypothetical protein